MLSARRKSDGQLVTAYFASKRDAPFICVDCNEEVLLKSGRSKIDHFAHVNPIACKFAIGESDGHRKCKVEIFKALRRQPNVKDVALERSFGDMRPDVYAVINGTRVAIEVQVSSLSIDAIMARTIRYAQDNIYVLWLLLWTPALDSQRYTPKHWENWIHAAYFGQVYYWIENTSVVSYHFERSLRAVPARSWFSSDAKRMSSGGFFQRLKKVRKPVRGEILNLVRDFTGIQRYWWEGGGIKVPDAKLYMRVRKAASE